MKALTICQPYAELIFRGEKATENRNWPTSYRGPLLIHAGKSREWLESYSPLPDYMDFGALVGIVDIADCLRACDIAASPNCIKTLPGGLLHVSGPWCFILRNPRRFITPIKYRGKQMFFNVPDEVFAAQPTLAGGPWPAVRGTDLLRDTAAILGSRD